MAGRFMGRKGRKELGNGQDSGGGSHVHTELSIQQDKQKGRSGGYPDIRGLQEAVYSSMRSTDGGSPGGSIGAHSDPAQLNNGRGLPSGGNGDGRHSDGSPKISISGIEIVECSQLPDVPDGHRKSFEEAISGTTEARVRSGDDVLSERPTELFERVFIKALETTEATLDLPTPHPFDENYPKILSLKQTAATAVINSGLKADENRLRRKETDVLAKLYATVQKEKLLIVEQIAK